MGARSVTKKSEGDKSTPDADSEPVDIEAQTPTPQVPEQQKKDRPALMLVGIFFLFLLIGGAWMYQEHQRQEAEQLRLKTVAVEQAKVEAEELKQMQADAKRME